MRYRPLGSTGIRVSALSFGAGTLGSKWGPRWTVTPSEADELVGCALDSGVNFFDTANVYNRGESETWLGRALDRAGARDRVVISTKFGYRRSADDLNSGGASRRSMLDSVETSLRRLRTDRIDLLYLHLWDDVTPVEETLAAADDLRRSGKIRWFGLSNVPAWYVARTHAIAQSAGQPVPVALQMHYNLAERAIEAEFVRFARHMGVGIVAWGPLANGLLSGKYHIDVQRRKVSGDGRITATFQTGDIDPFRPAVAATVEAIRSVGERLERPEAQIALAWLLQRDEVASIVVGVSCIDQLRQNLGSLDVCLDEAAVEQLDRASAEPVRYPHTFLEPDVQSLVHGTER